VPPHGHAEGAIADELRWRLTPAALIALGQQAEREGLVRIVYEGRYGRQYERVLPVIAAELGIEG